MMMAITRFFDLILLPFGSLTRVWGLAFISLLSALLILSIYKRVSNQVAIQNLKEKIQGYFLGIYLFRDDFSRIMECQRKVFSNTVRYMGHALRPLAIMIIPVGLICVQMQLRYGHSGLQPGETTILSAGIEDNAGLLKETSLSAGDGIEVLSPPLRIPARNEVNWRIGVREAGDHRIAVSAGGSETEWEIDAGEGPGRIYPARTKPALWNSIVYPGQETIESDSPVRYLKVDYPSAEIGIAGLRLHWSIIYFILVIIFGLALKRSLGVEF